MENNNNELELSVLCKYAGIKDGIIGSSESMSIEWSYEFERFDNLKLICSKINNGLLKLNLKPLSSITKDEWGYKLKMLRPSTIVVHACSDYVLYSFTDNWLDRASVARLHRIQFSRMHTEMSGLVDLLRSEGYDCDGLGEQGLAVYMDQIEEDPLFDAGVFSNPISENLKGYSNE